MPEHSQPPPRLPARARRPQRRLILALVACSLAGTVAGCGASRSGPKLGFSPAPGSPVASPQTQISIRGASASRLHDLTVTGSRSGRHPGRLLAHPEGLGASFVPNKPFDPGERVEVSVLVNGSTNPTQFYFTVARPVPLGIQAGLPGKATRAEQVERFHSMPDLHPPTVTVTAQSTSAAPGDIFLSPNNKRDSSSFGGDSGHAGRVELVLARGFSGMDAAP